MHMFMAFVGHNSSSLHYICRYVFNGSAAELLRLGTVSECLTSVGLLPDLMDKTKR